MDVSKRISYCDIETLAASGVPVQGEAQFGILGDGSNQLASARPIVDRA
jgi:predicted DNA-binding transcriptional regulator YafY